MKKTYDELVAQIKEHQGLAFTNITSVDTPELVKYWQGVFEHCQQLLGEEPEEKPQEKGEENVQS